MKIYKEKLMFKLSKMIKYKIQSVIVAFWAVPKIVGNLDK